MFSAAALGVGERIVTIIASDLAGNVSSLNFRLRILPQPDLRANLVRGVHRFRLSDTSGCRALRFEVRRGSRWETVREWGGTALAGEMTIADSLLPRETMRVVVEDNTGGSITLAYLDRDSRKKSTRLYTQREIRYDDIIYTLRAADAFDAPPVVRITQGATTRRAIVHPVAPDRYRAVLTSWPGFSGRAEVTVDYRIGGRDLQWKDSLRAFHIDARTGGALYTPGRGFLMTFRPGDVYRSMLCWVDTRSGDSLPSYTVYPDDEPLPGRPVVSIAVPGGTLKRYIDADSPVRKYRALERSATGALRAQFGRFLGTYSVREDADAPKISFRHVRRNRNALRISITDEGTGIDPQSVKVMLGNAIVPVEYSEHLQVFVVPYDIQKSHPVKTITISAADRLGNRRVEQFTL
jgi:hypothetical protein